MSDKKVNDEILSRDSVTNLIETRLSAYCHAEQQRANSLHAQYGQLWQSITDQVSGGGKRLRPYVTMLTYQAYGGPIGQPIIDVAAAWELLHISMLMHDDIIDRDYVRHGQANVAGHYLGVYAELTRESQKLHYAHSAALLAGDLVLSGAHRLVDDSQLDEMQSRQIKTLLYDATFEVIAGELLDTEVALIDFTIDLQLIAELKTASYSLIGPMLSGAMLAGSDEAQLDVLRQLGRCLGVGFQLADDILGVFGDESKTGKPADSDLAEGKRTVVIVEALKLMADSDRQQAETLLTEPSVENVAPLKSLITKTDVQSLLSKRLQTYSTDAGELIRQLQISEEARAQFVALAELLLKRSV